MHIIDKRNKERPIFESVHEGEVFRARNDYFIKTSKIVTLTGIDYNCVSLISGSPHYFNSDCVIEKLTNSKLMIY